MRSFQRFMHDNCPGGIGLSELLFHKAPTLIADALQLVRACACNAVCPRWQFDPSVPFRVAARAAGDTSCRCNGYFI